MKKQWIVYLSKTLQPKGYLTIIRPIALSGYGAIDPWPLRAKALSVLVSPN